MEFVIGGNLDRGVIADWYEELGIEAQEEFHARLKRLVNLQRHLWARPLFALERDGIGKIRFRGEGIQYRPLGWFGPNEGQFTLLFPAEERNGQFDPRDAVEQAIRRRRIILSDGGIRRVRKYDF